MVSYTAQPGHLNSTGYHGIRLTGIYRDPSFVVTSVNGADNSTIIRIVVTERGLFKFPMVRAHTENHWHLTRLYLCALYILHNNDNPTTTTTTIIIIAIITIITVHTGNILFLVWQQIRIYDLLFIDATL